MNRRFFLICLLFIAIGSFITGIILQDSLQTDSEEMKSETTLPSTPTLVPNDEPYVRNIDESITFESDKPEFLFRPSIIAPEDFNSGFGWGASTLSFVVDGEEIIRIHDTGEIKGENDRLVGQMTKNEIKAFMKVMKNRSK